MSEALVSAIERIFNIDIPVEGPRLTLPLIADRLQALQFETGEALKALMRESADPVHLVRHGNDKHNQAQFCSCDRCV